METDEKEQNEIHGVQMPKQYATAIDLVTGYTSKANLLSGQIAALTAPVYKPSLFSAITDFTQRFSSLSTIDKLLPTVDTFAKVSPMFDVSRQATLSVSHLAAPSSINSIASIVANNYKPWYEETILKSPLSALVTSQLTQFEVGKAATSINNLLNTDVLSQFSVQSSIAKMTELSVFAEKSLVSFPWDNLGSKVNITDPTKDLISSNFLGVSKHYSSLLKSFEENPISFTKISPTLTKSAPIEYFTGANLLEAISADEEQIAEEEIIKNEILLENESSLTSYLSRLDTGLTKMWHGANAALSSSNPDKVRHFSVSIRELFTHVIHILAPDEQIKKWSNDSFLYDKGKPTRKARLLFICRNISNDPLTKFVEKDVSATVEFLGLFQEGTHTITASFSEHQLIALKARAESTLRFLLEIDLKTSN